MLKSSITRYPRIKEIELIGNGREKRAFNYIDDFCDAFMKILSKGSKFQIYNIGTNQETNIKTLANTIAKYLNVKLKLKLVAIEARAFLIPLPLRDLLPLHLVPRRWHC